MKGGKKNARDRNFGIKDKDFWKWWHQQKPSGGGRVRDIENAKQARELYDEWVGNGKPKVK